MSLRFQGVKTTSKAKGRLFIISKISMIAATIISSRSVSTRSKATCTLALVILFAAGVVANTDADSLDGTGLHVIPRLQNTGSVLPATAEIGNAASWDRG